LIWALPDCGTETARMGANARPSITTETPSNSKGGRPSRRFLQERA
jgi:hypothetical protein